MAKLWEQRAARQAWFRTQGGRRVRVLYPGRPGRSAGPDFRDALLEMEGVGLVQGDVELHLRQRDWDSHGHTEDPNYNGVVLHAALEVNSEVTTLPSGQPAPVVALGQLLSDEVPPAAWPSASMWVLLERHGFAQPQTSVDLAGLLERAGDARFLDNSALFQTYLREQCPQQTLYEALLEGLGYRNNSQPFVKLAGLAPYGSLASIAKSTPRQLWEQTLESWLLQLSGLPPGKEQTEVPLPRRGFGPPMSPEEWHCFRVRPNNHPRRRIAGAARLVARFLETGLVPGLAQAASTGRAKDLTRALTADAAPSAGAAYVGANRAKDLAVNVALPFLHGHAVSCSQPGSGQEYLDLYRGYAKLQDNEVLREMADRLVGPACREVLTSARRQQGLLHLHRLLSGASQNGNASAP